MDDTVGEAARDHGQAVSPPGLSVGQTFACKQDLTTAVLSASARSGFPIKNQKSDRKRLVYVCANREATGCAWMLRGAPSRDGVWSVRTTVAQHTCTPGEAPAASRSSFGFREVASLFRAKLHEDPTYKPRQMQEDLRMEHGADCSYMVCFNAREHVLKELSGDAQGSLSRMLKLLTIFQQKNPGTCMQYEAPEGTFSRAFVASSQAVSAFPFLRPLVSLYGTDMENYDGTLLCAAGRDAVGRIVPLCYALVNEENVDNWEWFLMQFQSAFAIEEVAELTLLSRREDGLQESVESVFPSSHHGLCVRHLQASVRRRANNPALTQLVLELAQAKTAAEYRSRLDKIEGISEAAHKFLKDMDRSEFVDAFFPGKRFGQYTADVDESDILPECEMLPAQAFHSLLRRAAKIFIFRKKEAAREPGTFPKVLIEGLQFTKTADTEVTETADLVFAVEIDLEVFIVDLNAKTCSCGQFQDNKCPCLHAALTVQSAGLNVDDYIDPFYSTASLLKTYQNGVVLVSSSELEEADEFDVAAPDAKQDSDRPDRKRRRIAMDDANKRPLHCSKCGKAGHNKRSCDGFEP